MVISTVEREYRNVAGAENMSQQEKEEAKFLLNIQATINNNLDRDCLLSTFSTYSIKEDSQNVFKKLKKDTDAFVRKHDGNVHEDILSYVSAARGKHKLGLAFNNVLQGINERNNPKLKLAS